MKQFLTERDLDAMGLYSRAHRARLRKQGNFPEPIKLGGPGSKNFYTPDMLPSRDADLSNEGEAA
jgi:hypothetical protein